ncbi:MAG: DUF983 domain-containing protein [Rickettsiales bacterium]|nr:DUF983 domain-containing protein [Rickettsiales bacterium]
MRLTRCPRCAKGPLYVGYLKIAEACSECGLSFAGHEEGDGPAYLSILLIGTLAGMGAAIFEVTVSPAFWVHVVIWGPFIILGSLACLRISKAALISAQYQLRKDDFTSGPN